MEVIIAMEWEGSQVSLEEDDKEEEKGIRRKGRGKDGLPVKRGGVGGSHLERGGLMDGLERGG